MTIAYYDGLVTKHNPVARIYMKDVDFKRLVTELDADTNLWVVIRCKALNLFIIPQLGLEIIPYVEEDRKIVTGGGNGKQVAI